MDNKPYMTKEIKSDYKSKDAKVIVTPEGHQYVPGKGQTDMYLQLHGFRSISEARKAGWTFDGK